MTTPSSPSMQQNPMRYSAPGRFMNNFNAAALQQSLGVILNSSVIFKAFCLALIVGYLATFKENITPYVAVVPGKLLPPNFFLWTLITHSFIEYRIIELITDWFIILLYSKMLEPLWGTIECLQFYFIITISVAVSTAFFYIVAFAMTFEENVLFNISIHGLGGLLGALSVAIKQVMPDTIIVDVSFIRIKQDNLPLLLILVSFLVYLVNLTDFTYVVMLSSGVYYGWIYLRFFQKHKNGSRGDSSSTFVFAR
jgi:membrane associated rhomboid family serine protease